MIGTLTVVDDFLPRENFLAWRDLARRTEFQTVRHPRDGHEYKNVGLLPPGWSLVEEIAAAIAAPQVFMELEFLRLGEPGDGAGNIHCDDGDAKWASVYFLNTDTELRAWPSGTAFWRHRWLAADKLEPDVHPAAVKVVNDDRTNPAAWELLYDIPAKENRVIVYPTNVFHSRFPLDPDPGRLVHVAFFNL